MKITVRYRTHPADVSAAEAANPTVDRKATLLTKRCSESRTRSPFPSRRLS
jgi:hypothetical protein